MSTAGAIKAGRAFVELFVKDNLLVAGLAKAQATLAAFGARVSSLGASFKSWGNDIASVGKRLAMFGTVALGGLLGASKVFADMGSNLTDMSARTGLGVEAIQELGYAAKMTGATAEDLETGVKRMQKTLSDAAGGSASAAEALGMLGLTVGELARLSPEQQFTLIADRMARIPDPATRAAVAIEMFGRSGTKLLGMMAGGARGLDAFRQRARDLGIVLSEKDVAAADAFGDTLDTLWQSIKVGIARVGAGLVPALTKLAIGTMACLKTAGEWAAVNSGLVLSVAGLTVGIIAAGSALLVFGKVVAVVGTALTVFSAAVTVVSSLVGVVASLASPFGLVAIAAGTVAYLLARIIVASSELGAVGVSALARLSSGWATLKADAISSMGAITNALSGGNLKAAVNVLWTMLKMEWVKGCLGLKRTWWEFADETLNVWEGLFIAIPMAFTKAMFAIKGALNSAIGELQKAWIRFVAFFGDVWDVAVGEVKKNVADLKGMFNPAYNRAAAHAAIDAETAAKVAARAGGVAVKTGGIDAVTAAAKAALDAEERAKLSELADAAAARALARAGGRAPEIAAAEAELAAATKAWEDAKAAALAVKAKPDLAGGPVGPGMGGMGGTDLTGKSKAEFTSSAVGTFSGYAARGLGSGNNVAQIAQNTKRANDLLAKIADKPAVEWT